MRTMTFGVVLKIALLLAVGLVVGRATAEGEVARQLDAVQVNRLLQDTRIAFDDRRSQWLPDTVREVKTGPDGRVWYALFPRGWVPDGIAQSNVGAIMAAIERQFDQPAPKLPGVQVALFEPDGRVWFTVEPGHLLLGYAGRPGEWIVRRANDSHRFTGRANGVGNPSPGSGGRNQMVGNHRLFIDRGGVHVFDGESWTYHSLLEGHRRGGVQVRHSILEPFGRGVVFVTENAANPVWRFSRGAWSELPLPRRLRDPMKLRVVVPLLDGRYLVYALNEGMHVITPAGWIRPAKPTGVALLDRVVEQWWRGVLGEPEEALSVDTDLLPGGGPIALTPDGTALIAAHRSVRDERSRSGLISLGPGLPVAYARYLASPEIAEYLDGFADCPVNAAWMGDGRLFIAGSHRFRPILLDMRADPPGVEPVPNPSLSAVHTVAPGGQLFISTHHPYVNQDNPPIQRFDPDAKRKDQTMAATASVTLAERNYRAVALAPDGTLWVDTAGGGLKCYDGKQWRPVAVDLQENQSIKELIPGKPGVALAVLERRTRDGRELSYVLLSDDQRAGRRLKIEDSLPILRDAFAGVQDQHWTYRRTSVLIDAAGRLWLIRPDEGVQVFDDDGWRMAYDGKVENVKLLGDGEAVVVVLDKGPPRVLRWDDGEVTSESVKLPRRKLFVRGWSMMRSPNGSVWIGLQENVERRGDGRRYHTVEIRPDGKPRLWWDVGWPRLIETDGTVWLGGVGSFPGDGLRDEFVVIRDGERVQRLRIPRADYVTCLLSPSPGQVYAWNQGHLQTITREPPAQGDGPGEYRLGRVVNPMSDEKPLHVHLFSIAPEVVASPRGFFAANSTHPTGRHHAVDKLHVFEIPAER